MQRFKIALCQIIPLYDKTRNVTHAISMVEEAVSNGARMIVFPEIFYYPYDLQRIGSIVGDEEAIVDKCQMLAIRHRVYLCTGSMAYRYHGKLFNTSHLIGPDGTILSVYHKCHLFDALIKNAPIRESAVFTEGNHVRTVSTDLCTVGTLICYDIRFPEMAREISRQGGELLLVPAAFNDITGAAHWKCFMQTRATENQLFLAAISPGRSTDPDANWRAYGHSMVVSPWGEVLAEAGEDETIIYAELDPAVLTDVREHLPLLHHRRDRLYTSFQKDLGESNQ